MWCTAIPTTPRGFHLSERRNTQLKNAEVGQQFAILSNFLKSLKECSRNQNEHEQCWDGSIQLLDMCPSLFVLVNQADKRCLVWWTFPAPTESIFSHICAGVQKMCSTLSWVRCCWICMAWDTDYWIATGVKCSLCFIGPATFQVSWGQLAHYSLSVSLFLYGSICKRSCFGA